ncbi:uncharacterized protein (DUF2252 family) [Oryzihumus leptocrescens]|uniref:Uncharacterized protein (DUF2252 family) n=2 Tax=Oryzihumus leptocrescens TaxID=297536 RepID=A0A542ZIA9_9MICO|nr:uncharacterized protein (DUF2252 family) [Oryzihumus leptocrescens]
MFLHSTAPARALNPPRRMNRRPPSSDTLEGMTATTPTPAVSTTTAPSPAPGTPPSPGPPAQVAPEYLSPADRSARGKDARKRVPLESHADPGTGSGRLDPVTLLEGQAGSRVPELVPVRYGRMLVSPFTFYRGAALVMAADLARTPASGFDVQACGDAHLSNFGVYASPERRMVFDVNDFDETYPGPWEWDVKRLVASLAVAGRDNGFSAKKRRMVCVDATEAYRTAMREFAGQPNLAVWYASLDVDQFMTQYSDQISAKQLARAQENVAKARTKDNLQAFSKLTTMVDGQRRIISDPPVLVPIEELVPGEPADNLYAALRVVIAGYRDTLQPDRRVLLDQFRMVQVARKVVGVGSVGTRAWVILMLGRDDRDPLFLQAKEAQPSVLEPYLNGPTYGNQGYRVVSGQHLMQASSDIFLGTGTVVGIDAQNRDFYVRQLRDGKGSADVERMVPSGMRAYAQMCGWTLARAHARSGDRIGIAAYLGSSDRFAQAVADFAESYADQNEADFHALEEAERAGRIKTMRGI